MRQEDLDKLTARFNRLIRDMLEPGADYKLVLIVAERFVSADGQRLAMSLGTTAEPGVAANLCDMAADEYQSMAQSIDNETLIDAVNRVVHALERLRAERAVDEPPPPPTVTKH
jgi:hypothetical protein